MHMYVGTGSDAFVIQWGLMIGVIGAFTISLLNHWIRGESLSLKNALQVQNIDKQGPEGWGGVSARH
jgi:hypothetical protein